MCDNKHNQPCVVCSGMIDVAQTVLDKGFLKLKSAFKMVSPDITYTALHARRKLLQIPLVSLGIGDQSKGNYSIYLVEKQCSVQYKVFKSLLSNWINGQEKKSPKVNLKKETVKELLRLAESSGEIQRLKYAIVKAAGMSSTQAKNTYGFDDMTTKIGEVESALEDAAAIRDAIQSIAEVEDQAILHSLGIYDTTSENESECSDGSETDSDNPEDGDSALSGVYGEFLTVNSEKTKIMQLEEQAGKQASAEEGETDSLNNHQLVDILRCCGPNWIEFVRMVTGMQEKKQPNLTENMLSEFATKLSSLNLNNKEMCLIDHQDRHISFKNVAKTRKKMWMMV